MWTNSKRAVKCFRTISIQFFEMRRQTIKIVCPFYLGRYEEKTSVSLFLYNEIKNKYILKFNFIDRKEGKGWHRTTVSTIW